MHKAFYKIVFLYFECVDCGSHMVVVQLFVDK